MDVLRDKNILVLILSKCEEKDILSFCKTCKYYREKLCNDTFMEILLKNKYYDLKMEKYTEHLWDNYYYFNKITWYKYFLLLVHYKDKLKKEFNYDYVNGNILSQYEIFLEKKSDDVEKEEEEEEDGEKEDWYGFVINAIEYDEINLLKYGMQRGGDPFLYYKRYYDDPLEKSFPYINLDTMKYLIYLFRNKLEKEDEGKGKEGKERQINKFKQKLFHSSIFDGDIEKIDYFLSNGCIIDSLLATVQGKRYYASTREMRKVGCLTYEEFKLYKERHQLNVLKYLINHPSFTSLPKKEKDRMIDDVSHVAKQEKCEVFLSYFSS